MDQTVSTAEASRRQAPATTSSTAPGPQRRRGRGIAIRAAISTVLAILVLLVAASVFRGLASLKAPPPRDEPPPVVLRVTTYQTERADVIRYVAGFGTATADRQAVISAEVAGRITEADDLKVGRMVHGARTQPGTDGASQPLNADVLVQIDPQTYEEQLQQADALLRQDDIALNVLEQEHATNRKLLEQQKRRLETIQTEYDRRRELLKQGAGSEIEMERAKLELEQYRETLIRLENEIELYSIKKDEIQSRMDSHRSSLELAEADLAKATVRAPFTGRLSQVFVEAGQYVRPGEPIAEITDTRLIEVPVGLPIEDAVALEDRIRSGQEVAAELVMREEDFIRSDSRRWTGRVVRIAPVADVRTRTLQVFVEVNNDQQPIPLKPGAFVYARIRAEVLNASRGILVPRDAIIDKSVFLARRIPPEDRPVPEGESNASADSDVETEWARLNYRAVRQEITISDYFQTFAMVSAGLQGNEDVVMTNLDIIEEGAYLDVRDQASLPEELQRSRVPYLERASAIDAPIAPVISQDE